ASTAKAKLGSSKSVTDSPPGKRARIDEPESRSVKKQALEPSSTASAQGPSRLATATTATQSKPALPKPRPAIGILPGKSRLVSKPSAKLEPTKSEPSKPDP